MYNPNLYSDRDKSSLSYRYEENERATINSNKTVQKPSSQIFLHLHIFTMKI